MTILDKTITVTNGSDLSPVSDFTNDLIWEQSEFGSAAANGEATATTMVVRDEGGVIPDRKLPGKFLSSHNPVRVTVGSNTLYRGRIAGSDARRGEQAVNRYRQISVTLEDNNSQLRGIVVHDWARPAETDVQRVQALVAGYLSGNPRPSTNLNGSNLVISGSNTVSMPAKTYSAVTPQQILDEIASNADKEVFVTIDDELAYFGHDYTGYASLLRISDDPADANAVTYAPWSPAASEFGHDQLSALRVYWGPDEDSFRKTSGVAAETDYWEDVFWDSESVTAAQSEARAQKLIDIRALNELTYSALIGPMDGHQVYKIKPGQLIQFKSRAARAGRASDGSYTGDTFLTTRIRDLRWTVDNVDQYMARVELERPRRISRPSQGNQALATQSASNQPVEWVEALVFGHDDVDSNTQSMTRLDRTGDGSPGGGAGFSTWVEYLISSSPPNKTVGDSEKRHYLSFGNIYSGDYRHARLRGDVYPVLAQHVWGDPYASGADPTDHSCDIYWELRAGQWGTGTVIWDEPYFLLASGTLPAYQASMPVDVSWDYTTESCQYYLVAIGDDGQKYTRVGGGPPLVAHIVDECVTRHPPGGGIIPQNDHYIGGVDFDGDTFSLTLTTPVSSNQPVSPFFLQYGNGSTSTFTLNYSYAPGSIRVWVDALEQGVTETDPDTGTFTLAFAPLSSERIVVSFNGA